MGVRDRVRLHGMQLEREVEAAKWEALFYVMQLLGGNKETSEFVEKIVKSLKDTLTLKVFTEEYKQQHKASKDSDFELLKKLNKLGD